MSRNVRQGYSMKEKKAIVDYIVSNDAFGRVKGRGLWTDFENSGGTGRTWQSAKEVFIKRILPEINNPYYKLSAEQINFFRRGLSQPPGNTLDWICKGQKSKENVDDKNIPIGRHEITDKSSDSELVLTESGKVSGEPRISVDGTPIANSDNMNQLIDIIGQNEPINRVNIFADSELIAPKDIVDSVNLSSDSDKIEFGPLTVADGRNVRNQKLPIDQLGARQNLLDNILLPSSSSSEEGKNTPIPKNLSSKLGFSTGKTFVSRNPAKKIISSEVKNVDDVNRVSKTYYPKCSSDSLKDMRLRSKRSHRVLSSTESSSNSESNNTESDSDSNSSEYFSTYSHKANGNRKTLVKTRKPMYAYYKGELYPLYVAKSKAKFPRPNSVCTWQPTSHRSRKSRRMRKYSAHSLSKHGDGIEINTDSDEHLSYYEGPEKRHKRHTEYGKRVDSHARRDKLHYRHSSNENRFNTNISPLPSPGRRPPETETRIKTKIQDAAQSRSDLDFPNDEIEMRYYRDLERYFDSGQVGKRPVKEFYQRVLTEEEKRKHKKYSHLYKKETEKKNAASPEDSQSFWKIRYLMEKKNFNEVCKYMAKNRPVEEITQNSNNNSLISLNDKPFTAENLKNAHDVNNKNEIEIIDVDGNTNCADKFSRGGHAQKEVTKNTSPKPSPKKPNCIIKYSKHGEDIVNNEYNIDTQKENLLFSVLKTLDAAKSPATSEPVASSDTRIIHIQDSGAVTKTSTEAIKSKEKLSRIQQKEEKIFYEIEKHGELINSSDSGKRDIFTPFELALLLNDPKFDGNKPNDPALVIEEMREGITRNSNIVNKDNSIKNAERNIVTRQSPRMKIVSDAGPSQKEIEKQKEFISSSDSGKRDILPPSESTLILNIPKSDINKLKDAVPENKQTATNNSIKEDTLQSEEIQDGKARNSKIANKSISIKYAEQNIETRRSPRTKLVDDVGQHRNQTRQQQTIIKSSASDERDIFTPLELTLLLNDCKSDGNKLKDTAPENTENKETSIKDSVKEDALQSEGIQGEQARNSKLLNKDIGNKYAERNIELRPRIKIIGDAGPSHSTPKAKLKIMEKTNIEESISYIQKAENSPPKIETNGKHSKDDDLFFVNAKFQLNPEYKNLNIIPKQKTQKVDSVSTSDSDTTYAFPKASRPKWKISLQQKSNSKRKSNQQSFSPKKRHSEPMKNVTNTRHMYDINIIDLHDENGGLIRDVDNSKNDQTDKPFIFNPSMSSAPIVESLEIPLQNKLFNFLNFFHHKKTSETDSNTINFNLQDNRNMHGAAYTQHETVVNTSLPLLEQDVIFPIRSDVEDIITRNNSVEDRGNSKILDSIKNFSADMFSDEEIHPPTNEKYIEDPKDLNPTYEKEDRLCILSKMAVSNEYVENGPSDEQFEENIEPQCDDLFNTTASSSNYCDADFILKIASNNAKCLYTSKHGENQATKSDFNSSAYLMELKNMMTEEEFSEQ